MSASGGTARPPEPPSSMGSPAMPDRNTLASLPPTGTARFPRKADLPPSSTRSPAMPNRKTPASLPPTGTGRFPRKTDMPPASREGESAVFRSWRLAFRRLSSPAGA